MYVGKERNCHGSGGRCALDCSFGNLDREVVKMIKVNRYWNSDPDSLVECERPQTYDLCKCCELVNQLVWREKRLKRALWLARAERAKWQSLYYWYAICEKYKSRKFDEVERKCRAKAEQYE